MCKLAAMFHRLIVGLTLSSLPALSVNLLDPFRSLNLPAATEAKILSGNAQRLFKL